MHFLPQKNTHLFFFFWTLSLLLYKLRHVLPFSYCRPSLTFDPREFPVVCAACVERRRTGK